MDRFGPKCLTKSVILLGPKENFSPKSLAKNALLLGPEENFGPKSLTKSAILLGLSYISQSMDKILLRMKISHTKSSFHIKKVREFSYLLF